MDFGQGLIFAATAMGSLLYLRGAARIWHRNGIGRGVRLWQVTCFAGSVGALLVAWTAPFCNPSIRLLCADTARHMILFCVAPPLLVLAAPLPPVIRGLPTPWRQRALAWLASDVGRSRVSLPLAASVQIAILALVHTRPVLEAGTGSAWAEWGINLALLAAGLAFWAVALPQRYSLSHPNGAAAFWLLFSCGAVWLLGGVMTHGTALFYPAYDRGVTDEVWSALVDQQIAGLVVLLAGLVFLVAAFAMLVRRHRAIRQRDQSTAIMADSLPLTRRQAGAQGGGNASALIGPRGGGAVLGGGSP